MADLPTEYTDTKGIRHEVEHFNIAADDTDNREEIFEELFHVLEVSEKRSSFSNRNATMKGSGLGGNHPLCP